MRRILLVEDSRFLRLTSERSLAHAGYKVVSTGDGAEALPLARKHSPDLILLDMLLPNLGGPEVLQALKEDEITAKIPVVVLSSLSQANEEKLKQQGAVAYFEKSKLDSNNYCDSLLETVKDALQRFSPSVMQH